ncbi:MAG: thiamine phosphate synthase [Candidatus Omnitrophica bacterium]|nr:thiamine phosphate synthase [Candidatus Omnitrophota bacterium]
MRSNVTSCLAWRLYVILDRAAAQGRALPELAAAAIRGGADVLQLRDKTASARSLMEEAKRLLAVTRPAGIPLIINDRADVARAVGADGVHLGQDDLPLADARALLGSDRIIGASTHTLDQALAAAAEGVDYIGIGPIFSTPTKPEYPSVGLDLVRQVTAHVRVPGVCIGGIDRDHLDPVLGAGGACVAVVRAVCCADDPEVATRELKMRIEHFHRATLARSL